MVVIRQKQVLRSAQLMLERYGNEALQQVDLRILELQQHGEKEAVELWREIRSAVKTLSQFGPSNTTQ